MIDPINHGQDLLKEWNLYKTARPREHVFDIQRDKDELAKWATLLQFNLMWEQDYNRVAEVCHQFESRLTTFKDKIVIELLTGGSV